MASTDGASVAHQEVKELAVGGRRGRLSDRILLVAALSVLAALGIALVVAFPLVKSETEAQARAVLSRQADTLASLFVNRDLHQPGSGLRPGPNDGDDHGPGENREKVLVYAVTTLSQPIHPITLDDIATVTSGTDLSTVRSSDGLTYYVEGRGLGFGEGVLLVQRDVAAETSAATLLSRLALALIAGLTFALLLALFVARRTARPLKLAAIAAGRLADGERDVDVKVEGAAEVADIAAALNRLTAALAASEDRQRDFLLSVSHELRTPMTSIKGYAEAMADGVLDASDLTVAGAVLLAEGERLDRLVSDLLDLSRSGAVDFQLHLSAVDVAQVVTQAADSWRLRCERDDLTVTAELPSLPVLSELDPTRLRQIVDNLMENAVRITPAGGHIRLAVGQDSEGAFLSVEDSGPGLSDDDLPVAFQPAVLNSRYRKEREVGTGLGLALVGRLATRMGGTAVAGHSELGGAKFIVRFPVQTDLKGLAD